MFDSCYEYNLSKTQWLTIFWLPPLKSALLTTSCVTQWASDPWPKDAPLKLTKRYFSMDLAFNPLPFLPVCRSAVVYDAHVQKFESKSPLYFPLYLPLYFSKSFAVGTTKFPALKGTGKGEREWRNRGKCLRRRAWTRNQRSLETSQEENLQSGLCANADGHWLVITLVY